ncbi:16629_t:CDS:2 [Dentiscutata heterogama]|uniref:16629_t:CDS:1 n=1 Tax=Dentiscutata heterogama TaxID=1316150 RepID=A0ACA9K3T7_9GLOM|nr:16629_t:CDS:2 [Dentiscutata heterogama]
MSITFALQPKIPEAPISESDDSSALIRDRVVIKSSAPEPPRIYEAPISELDDEDDEDMGLDLFED